MNTVKQLRTALESLYIERQRISDSIQAILKEMQEICPHLKNYRMWAESRCLECNKVLEGIV